MTTETSPLSRQPTVLDYSSPTQFRFMIHQLPKVEFFTTAANIPSITLGELVIPTPYKSIPILGDNLTFDNLTISFIVDEELQNYRSIHDWMVGIGFPKSRQQFIDFRSGGGISFRAKSSSETMFLSQSKVGIATTDNNGNDISHTLTINGNMTVSESLFQGAITASSLKITNNAVIDGDIISNRFITSESISVINTSSGSTAFGNTNDDVHQFTGSLKIQHTGSSNIGLLLSGSDLRVDGDISASGFIDINESIRLDNGKGMAFDVGGPNSISFLGAEKQIAYYSGSFPQMVFDLSSNNNLPKVGIGTTTPAKELTVTGDISASGDINGDTLSVDNTTLSSGEGILFPDSTTSQITIGKSLSHVTQGTTIHGHITASGNISSSGTGIFNKLEVHGADGTLQADYIIHKDDENTKFGFPSNDHFKIRTAGTDRYVVDTVHQFTGEITADNHITFENNKEIKQKDSGGTGRTIIELDSSNDLNIGGSYAGSLKIIGGGSYAEVARFDDDGHFAQVSGKNITTNEITASGNISSSGTGSFGMIHQKDNEKIVLGTGRDFQIYHSGANSFIQDQGTGDLKILGTNLKLQDKDGGDYLTATDNAGVKIFFNDSEKLETTNTGINVTGEITASGNISSSGDLFKTKFVQMTNSSSVVDTFNTSSFRSAKYVLQVVSASNQQLSEMLVLHHNATASNTEYAQINSGLNLINFTTDVSDSNVRLNANGSFISCSVRLDRIIIPT